MRNGQTVEKDQWYTIRQVETILGDMISSIWLRRQVTKSDKWFQSRRKIKKSEQKEVWVVSGKDVLDFHTHLEQKERRRQLVQEGKIKAYTYKRPTKFAEDKMRKTIREDRSLTKAQRKFMVDKMNEYSEQWEREYKAREAKKRENRDKTSK